MSAVAANPAGDDAEPVNAVIGYALEGDKTRTLLRFELAGPADATVRSLVDPPRVIVDLPETVFRLAPESGKVGHGLIRAFRFGLIEAGKSRVVIDTIEPVQAERVDIGLDEAGGAFRLDIDLVPTTRERLAALDLAEAALTFKPAMMELGGAPASGSQTTPPVVTGSPAATPALRAAQAPHRPVIVVDAGHGGIDPGASGARGVEKDLVLSVAQQIEKALKATRAYDVVMTRSSDVFISLDDRVAIAQKNQADLFLSIHADSIPGLDAAKHVRGATVYTLSEHASDDWTRRVADKENAADVLAGLPASTVSDDTVRGILMDLMWRETTGFAVAFRETLISELRKSVLLSRDPRRSGPFRVLKNPSSPAVLVELGYISNAEDERIMAGAAWQAKVAADVARAVKEHFRQRLATRR